MRWIIAFPLRIEVSSGVLTMISDAPPTGWRHCRDVFFLCNTEGHVSIVLIRYSESPLECELVDKSASREEQSMRRQTVASVPSVHHDRTELRNSQQMSGSEASKPTMSRNFLLCQASRHGALGQIFTYRSRVKGIVSVSNSAVYGYITFSPWGH